MVQSDAPSPVPAIVSHPAVPELTDLSLAKTWTSPDGRFGNFSTFLETYARTDLDGPEVGHKVVSLTPGLRFNVRHHHVFMLGIELPVTHSKPYEQIIRFTYIYAF